MPFRHERLLGVGVDLVEIARAERLVRRHPDGVKRFLIPSEMKLLRAAANRPLAFALLFAAKEAASKSVGQSLLGPGAFRDFVVGRQGARLVVRWACRTRASSGVRIELFPFLWNRVAGMLAYSYRSP